VRVRVVSAAASERAPGMLPRINTRACLEAIAGKPSFAVTATRFVTCTPCREETHSRCNRDGLHAASRDLLL
jgi:hypothetical protein